MNEGELRGRKGRGRQVLGQTHQERLERRQRCVEEVQRNATVPGEIERAKFRQLKQGRAKERNTKVEGRGQATHRKEGGNPIRGGSRKWHLFRPAAGGEWGEQDQPRVTPTTISHQGLRWSAEGSVYG